MQINNAELPEQWAEIKGKRKNQHTYSFNL